MGLGIGGYGAVAGMNSDAAYLARLAIVEGHLIAAADLYKAGLVDDAIGLSYHPEAEMMDEVRASLAAHGQADFTPLMQALSAEMEAGTADVQPALMAFQAAVDAAVDAAVAAEAPDTAMRFQVAVAVVRAAMDPAAAAFGAANGGFVANDPAILLAVAARVELISSQVR